MTGSDDGTVCISNVKSMESREFVPERKNVKSKRVYTSNEMTDCGYILSVLVVLVMVETSKRSG